MAHATKGIYRFNVITNNIQWHFHRKKTVQNVETTNYLNSQSHLEREEQSWRYHTPLIQTIVLSYSNQNNMIILP